MKLTQSETCPECGSLSQERMKRSITVFVSYINAGIVARSVALGILKDALCLEDILTGRFA